MLCTVGVANGRLVEGITGESDENEHEGAFITCWYSHHYIGTQCCNLPYIFSPFLLLSPYIVSSISSIMFALMLYHARSGYRTNTTLSIYIRKIIYMRASVTT